MITAYGIEIILLSVPSLFIKTQHKKIYKPNKNGMLYVVMIDKTNNQQHNKLSSLSHNLHNRFNLSRYQNKIIK